MTNISALTKTSALAALLVFAAPAVAQQQDLSEEEVRSYLERLQQEVMEIVRNKEFRRVDEMTERHIAEGAAFAVTGEMMKDDRRKSFMAATLERADIVAMKHRAVGMMQGVDIADYTLDVAISEVRVLGSGAAAVKATWTDSGAISAAAPEATAPAAADQAQTGQAQPGPRDSEARSLTFERTFECHHVIEREGEQLKIGLTACQGEVRL